MCGSKTSSQQTQQQSQTTTPNPAAVNAYNTALGMASTAASKPYTPYAGELTAPINAQEQTATNALNGLGAASNGYFSNAAYQSGLGAAAINPTTLDGAAIQQYESPYQSQVISATEAQLANTDAQQDQQQTSNAIGAGAFGGDRAGVAQATLAGQQALANNATVAGLENQNYAQALQTAEGQQSLGLGAAQANRAAIQQNAALQAGLGSASATAGTGIADAQLQAGALQQQTQQAADTAQYGQFEQALAYPFQTAQFYSNIAEGIAPNMGSTSTGDATSTTQTSPLNAVLGLGIAGLGKFSDERLKDDIKPVGRTFDGQTIYSFRYKGDDVTHLGLIAQRVEKKHPGAVKTLGDAKIVDYAEATRKAADKGHFARGGRTDGLGAAAFHKIYPDEIGLGRARAVGGSVGTMPYPDGVGYVPAAGALPPGHSSTPNLNFGNMGQAGQQQVNAGLSDLGAGIGVAAQSAKSSGALSSLGDSLSNGLGSAVYGTNSLGMPNFARGGRTATLGDAHYFIPRVESGLGAARLPHRQTGGLVPGLGAARIRRGYDGGGVVGDNAMMFDPGAVGTDSSFAPGLGLAGAALPPSTPPTGLALAALPSGGSNVPTYTDRGEQGIRVLADHPYTQALGAASLVPSQAPTGVVPPASNDSGASSPTGVAPPASAYTSALGAARIAQPTPPDTGGVTGLVPPAAAIDSAAPASPEPLGGYKARVRSIESRGDDTAVSPSGATSRYQFEPSTWADVAQKHPDLGLTPTGITDPNQQERAMDAFTADNRAELMQALGRQPSPDELYLAHQQGAAGAAALIKNPSVRAGSLVGDSHIAANGGDPNAPAGSYTGMWSTRFNRTGTLGDARAYASDSSGVRGDLGDAAVAGAQAANSGLGLASLSRLVSPALGGTGVAGPGHSGGWLGLLPGISDTDRDGMVAAGLGMAASKSKSPLIALGEGGLQGVKAEQTSRTLQREAANTASEIQNRAATQGIEHDKVKIAAGQLAAHLQEVAGQLGNFKSEDAYRKGDIENRNAETSIKRYEVLPSPDGKSFSYYDKVNPSAGIIFSDKGIPGVPGSAKATTPAPMIDASGFTKTGRPTLAAPEGYLPTNYYVNQLRQRSNPAFAEATAAQTKADVESAAAAAQKGHSAVYAADEMDRGIGELSKQGLLKPGAAFPERLNLAKTWNLAAPSLGLPTVDESATGVGQQLIKDQTRLATSLTMSLGNREAASVFGAQLSATPGPGNTEEGYRKISTSLRVLAQRDIDRAAFVQDYLNKYGSTGGGDADLVFNAMNPPMMYARHAQALAKVPADKVNLLQQYADDPRAISAFEQTFGKGLARYFVGGQ